MSNLPLLFLVSILCFALKRFPFSLITFHSNDIILSGQTVVGGVAITDVRIGEGVLAEEGVTVWIGYIGKLPDGTVFDDSTGNGLYSFVHLGSLMIV